MTATAADTDLLDRARALRGLIESEADAAERADTMTAPVIDALRDTSLFWLMVPEELGGLETDIVSAISVFEELAYADGSTGWSMMANATATCFAAIYSGDAAVAAMFGGDAPPIVAGMFGPGGRVRRADTGDGYVLSGDYQFGSGCAHADWFSAGAMEMRDGEVVMTPSGLPSLRVSFVPRERVELRGNWDVLGLVATGSFDYAVVDEPVEADYTFLLVEAAHRRGGPQYRLGLLGMTAAGHAGFALGVGRRALDEVVRIARRKQRLGGEPVAEQQLFQHDLGMHDAAMRAARAYVLDVFSEAEAAAVRDGAPTLVLAQRMRQATTYATRVAADAARFAYTWAGSSGLRPGALQRCFRDIHAGTQHVFVDNNTLTAYAQVLLAEDAE
jgi:alkylation response protein AidB-like acyl-CoA dehydrogenase